MEEFDVCILINRFMLDIFFANLHIKPNAKSGGIICFIVMHC